MKITPPVFQAFLKCPTKCWLRHSGEPTAGNVYAESVQAENKSYRINAVTRLLDEIPKDDCALAPAPENLKSAQWRITVDVVLETEDLNTQILAVERIPSEGRGKPAQFIPIRFIFRNKLTQDDKLLLAFDAFVLSEMLGREVSLGKIIHGDDHATLKMKTSALFGEVRKRIEKITALLSNSTPPDLVLNRHCAECKFQSRCRKIAVEKDDLSLLSGMSEMERSRHRSKGIFTVTQLSYTFRPRRTPKRAKTPAKPRYPALQDSCFGVRWAPEEHCHYG